MTPLPRVVVKPRSRRLRVALAQIATRVGDVPGNEARILEAVAQARGLGASLVVFPEMALTGYPPRDLLFREELVRETGRALRRIAAAAPDLTVVVGAVEAGAAAPGGRPLRRNVACVLEGGALAASRAKTLLPSYDVFQETRWFEPGRAIEPVALAGIPSGLLVCEDMWDEGYAVKPGPTLLAAGARLLVCLSASPYRIGVQAKRLAHARRLARRGVPVVYVNAVGAEDELVFDGGSFVLDASGELLASLPRFEEKVALVELEIPAGPSSRDAAGPSPRAAGGGREGGPRAAGVEGNAAARTEAELRTEAEPCLAEEVFRALTLGIRDFARKNGLAHAFLGLSGGVDSALVACLAREALGPERVTAIALPSRFNDPRSEEESRALARTLGIAFEVVAIEPLLRAAEETLAPLLGGETGTTHENLQARLRMLVLMAHVNRRGGVLLNTSNKTELALGYGTLYGDMAGGLAPIADLTKPLVYELARWYSARGGAIPSFILERPASAELAPGQVDPFDYPRVAPLVEALIEGTSAATLVARGADAREVERLERLIKGAEHKRRQAPIGLKVTETAFGSGRTVPVTQGFRARTDEALTQGVRARGPVPVSAPARDGVSAGTHMSPATRL